MMKVSCLIKWNALKSETRRRRTTSGCGGVLAEFEPKSTNPGQLKVRVEAGSSPVRAGGALAEVFGVDRGKIAEEPAAIAGRSLPRPNVLGSRPGSISSRAPRLSEVRHDNGRCQPEFSNENSANAVRRSALDSW